MRLLAAVLAFYFLTLPLAAADSFESFVDTVMADEMAAAHVPGAVVVVVRDGKVAFRKGYGFANLETRTAVDPATTIFRIGSITKVFTATAVMQLAERGKLSVTDDVNRYLPAWKVAATFPQPITFARLLTHSAGLDEIAPGRRTNDPAAVIPLGEFLRTRIVRRMPPATIVSYSTYNPALAGYVAEVVGGMPLRDWFAANIFTPLGMAHTSLGAIPAAQQRDRAVGYAVGRRGHRPLPFEYFHTYPASDINSTGDDMARFLIAQLDGDARLLGESALRDMQRRQFANHPAVAGMGYGWFENRRNGLAAVEHGGTMEGYAALLWLAPRERFGVFVAGNIENSAFPIAVRNAIVDRELPPKPRPAPVAIASTKAAVERFAGEYRNDIFCHSCSRFARGFLPSAVRVTANDDGSISLWGGKWVMVEPLVFRLVSGRLDTGESVIAFREDAAGRITHFFNGTWSHERVGGR